jgi:excisionase family DNA binding protein
METQKIEQSAWMSYQEAMRYCGLGRTLLTQLVTSGQIPAARVGRRVLISRRGLDEYLQSNSYAEVGR